MKTYANVEDYTDDVENARAAYLADEAVRAGFCAVCKRRKRDTNGRRRQCTTCRHEGRKETS
jgi:hypothetical protein